MTERFPGMISRTSLIRATAVLACVLAVGGCQTTKNLFKGKGGDKDPKPAKLVEFAPSATVSKLWSINVGKGEKSIGTRQHPAIADGHVYAAAGLGGVDAIDLQTGKVQWTYRPKERKDKKTTSFSGGPGVGSGLVVVGTLEGDVIALDQATGTEKWSGKLLNEILAAPAIGNGVVVVHSNDGKVTAFDAATGEKRWTWSSEPVPLSVRGNSTPVIGPGYVFVGTDGGKLVALSLTDGGLLWETTVADADGRSDIARMNDSDGAPVMEGNVLYASSYKPRTIAVDAPSGQLMWVQEHGGVGGIGISSDRVVVSDSKDIVWGMDRISGAPMWQQNGFTLRNISAPVVQGGYAVVGDYQGYLHWLKLADGQLAARTRMTSKAIAAQPVVSEDGVLVAQDIDGNIAAFRVSP